jgi:hypothetical protein
LIEDRGDAGHARGERDGMTSFQEPDDLLERFPRGRAVVSCVGALGTEDEIRGWNGGPVQRRSRAPVASCRDEQ